MREASGRSRGFGFLTFKDPRVVNTVMVKEHFLDGKIVRATLRDPSPRRRGSFGSAPGPNGKRSRCLRRSQIDPKRAIPRDEQEKTSKIFVGGVSQDASEGDFTAFFAQFGRVVDATLMMDKDTGRPRGFGFVTFDSEAAVDKCLAYHPLEILGKPIEVKKAQPRGKMGEEDDSRGGRGRGKFGRDDRYGNDNTQSAQGQNAPAQGVTGASGMTPQMMAQYWQRMQQYFAMMQQQMAATAMSGGMGMNPQMMAQMQQMQQMQNMQKQMGGQSPNPAMQQQMMQMMQMQQNGGMGVPGAPTGPGGPPRTGSFSAQEQLAFEQRKYEQQHAKASRGPSNQHRGGGGAGAFNQQQNSSGGSAPQSWEGMYDDVPQPNEGGRASSGGSRTPVSGGPGKAPKGPAAPPPSNAPANAPTGPKNPGKPGANWRGGGRGRFHPYGR